MISGYRSIPKAALSAYARQRTSEDFMDDTVTVGPGTPRGSVVGALCDTLVHLPICPAFGSVARYILA